MQFYWDIAFSCSFLGGGGWALVVKNLPANAGYTRDIVSIPGSRNSLGVGNGNPHQYSCLGNSMDSGVWQGTLHEAAKSLK